MSVRQVRHMAEAGGLRVAHMEMLAIAIERQHVGISELVTRMDLDAKRVAFVARTLQRRGFLTKVRDPEDDRCVIFSPTPAAVSLIKRLQPGRNAA